MESLIINGSHLVAAGIAFAIVNWLARQDRLAALYWPAVIAGSALLAAALFHFTEPVTLFEDFRRAYWEAGVAVWQDRAAFDALYARGTDGYVNLPIIAWLFAPFGLLGEHAAAIAFALTGGAAVVACWLMLSRLLDLDRAAKGSLLVAFAVFGPLLYSLREGNLTHILLALILMGMLDIRSGRDIRAGLLFGVVALLKPPLALIGIYFLLRARWRVVAGGAAMIMGATLASLAVYGWDLHVVWFQTTIAPFAAGPTPAFNVQSLPAFALRQELGVASYLDWTPHALGSAGRIAAMAAAAVVILTTLWSMVRKGAWRPGGSIATTEVELVQVIALACVVSTLSWSHYYVWLLPAYAMVWARGEGVWRWLALAAFVLSAPVEFMSGAMQSGGYGPLSNLLTSHLLFGGILLVACLSALRVRTSDRLV